MEDRRFWLDDLISNWWGILRGIGVAVVWLVLVGFVIGLVGLDTGGWLSFLLGLLGILGGGALATSLAADKHISHGLVVGIGCAFAAWIAAAFTDIETAAQFRGLLVLFLSYPACGVVGAVMVSSLHGLSEESGDY